jgi:integrase
MRGLYADMAVESYGDERIAAKLLGHTNPAVTMKHYAKPGTLHDIHTARVSARLGN